MALTAAGGQGVNAVEPESKESRVTLSLAPSSSAAIRMMVWVTSSVASEFNYDCPLVKANKAIRQTARVEVDRSPSLWARTSSSKTRKGFHDNGNCVVSKLSPDMSAIWTWRVACSLKYPIFRQQNTQHPYGLNHPQKVLPLAPSLGEDRTRLALCLDHCDEAALHGGRTCQCPAGTKERRDEGTHPMAGSTPTQPHPWKDLPASNSATGCGPILLHIGVSGHSRSKALTKAEFLSTNKNKKYLLKNTFFFIPFIPITFQ